MPASSLAPPFRHLNGAFVPPAAALCGEQRALDSDRLRGVGALDNRKARTRGRRLPARRSDEPCSPSSPSDRTPCARSWAWRTPAPSTTTARRTGTAATPSATRRAVLRAADEGLPAARLRKLPALPARRPRHPDRRARGAAPAAPARSATARSPARGEARRGRRGFLAPCSRCSACSSLSAPSAERATGISATRWPHRPWPLRCPAGPISPPSSTACRQPDAAAGSA